jgi:hypothetical protein
VGRGCRGAARETRARRTYICYICDRRRRAANAQPPRRAPKPEPTPFDRSFTCNPQLPRHPCAMAHASHSGPASWTGVKHHMCTTCRLWQACAHPACASLHCRARFGTNPSSQPVPVFDRLSINAGTQADGVIVARMRAPSPSSCPCYGGVLVRPRRFHPGCMVCDLAADACFALRDRPGSGARRSQAVARPTGPARSAPGPDDACASSSERVRLTPRSHRHRAARSLASSSKY